MLYEIWKFPIEKLDDSVLIDMPVGAKVLHVAAQGGLVCLWARVRRTKGTATREFLIRGTGHPIEDDLSYLGTAHISPFVWHIFERQ